MADLVFWGPGLCCSWPGFPDRLQLALETFRHLHLWPQKLFPTSAPTFEDLKRLEGRGMGQRKERGVIMEESGVLKESETPSRDLLGYRDS